jgi:peptide/nickel transport system ATP-binding protein
MGPPLVQVRELKVHFRRRRTSWRGRPGVVHAVDGVSFDIPRGSAFGLVGESGCGKTTTAMALMQLVRPTSGSVLLEGVDLTRLSGRDLRQARRRMQMVFQDPYSALNPRARAGALVRAPLDLMGVGSPGERESRVLELFEAVGLRAEQRFLFPHQFSGGQRQRINIARALATRPEVVVCDEPVSALDVAVRAQTLNLLRRLQLDMGLTYLFISHDMSVVSHLCDEIAVMYLGQIVERAPQREFFRRTLHPYSRALMSAVPRIRAGPNEVRRIRLEGDPPNPIDPPPGCRFAPRCPYAQQICRTTAPPLRPAAGGVRSVACHFADEFGAVPEWQDKDRESVVDRVTEGSVSIRRGNA